MKDTFLEIIQYGVAWIKDYGKNIEDQILIMNATIIQNKNKTFGNENLFQIIIKLEML